MTKIEFHYKSIFIAENYDAAIQELGLNNALVIFDFSKKKLQQCIDLLMLAEIEAVLIIGVETEVLHLISQTFKAITAGGGLVQNSRKEYLFIFRRHKWDLPKGKQEQGEDIEQCALREVREETGLQNIAIVRPLIKTYHIYLENELIFKETHWFLMFSNDSRLRPQREEGIEKALWIAKNDLSKPLKNTYQSIKDIMAISAG